MVKKSVLEADFLAKSSSGEWLGLPLEGLADIAKRDGVRPRPIYGAHKWFARRLGTATRSLLVGAATDESGAYWKKHFRNDLLQGWKVLDPYMGGGVLLTEAQRLGAECSGVDIDPIAVGITDFQMRIPFLAGRQEDLKDALDRVESLVLPQVAEFYKTKGEEGETRVILHTFWGHVVSCGECETDYIAQMNWVIASDENADVRWVLCRHCGNVEKRPYKNQSFVCRKCRKSTTLAKGSVKRGVATCPVCKKQEKIIDKSITTGSKPTFRMVAIESLPDSGWFDADSSEPQCHRTERVIHRPTSDDLERYRRAEKKWKAIQARNSEILADSQIPVDGRTDDRLLKYGYTYYSDLFCPRQKLHLALLSEAIGEERDSSLREALEIAFSNHLRCNCMQASYASGWGRLTPLFSVRAFRHIVRPTELNPWLRKNGRGTFPNAIRSIVRAVDWWENQKEHKPEGGFELIGSADSVGTDVRLGDARSLSHISTDSIDLVLTDPPYFDFIAYSELADFFRPWLTRFGLIETDPEQAGGGDGFYHDATSFAQLLCTSFVELRRVIKEDGMLAFSFQHSKVEGWVPLVQGLIAGGFSVVNVFPIRADSPAGPHKNATTCSWDAIMVCRPSSPTKNELMPVHLASSDYAKADSLIQKWEERLSGRSDIGEADFENLKLALLVQSTVNRCCGQGDVSDSLMYKKSLTGKAGRKLRCG